MNIQAAIWRDLARQAAETAAKLHDPQARLSVLTVAAGYDAMATRAEATKVPRAFAIRVRSGERIKQRP